MLPNTPTSLSAPAEAQTTGSIAATRALRSSAWAATWLMLVLRLSCECIATSSRGSASPSPAILDRHCPGGYTGAPVEFVGVVGDLLLWHHWLVHSPSANTNAQRRPRPLVAFTTGAGKVCVATLAELPLVGSSGSISRRRWVAWVLMETSRWAQQRRGCDGACRVAGCQ